MSNLKTRAGPVMVEYNLYDRTTVWMTLMLEMLSQQPDDNRAIDLLKSLSDDDLSELHIIVDSLGELCDSEFLRRVANDVPET